MSITPKVSYVLVFTLLVLLSSKSNSQNWVNQTYNPNTKHIELNPMKGLMPSYNINSDVPYSVDHFYIQLNDVIIGKGNYDWSAFEKKLVSKSVGGRTVVPRFWTFYPGKTNNIGIPKYLINNGLKMYNVPDSANKCPEWNDDDLTNCFSDFIVEFAKKYDGDPRILMIEMGLYGSWGEWNISSAPKGITEMSFKKREKIATTYVNAFKKTHIALRRADRVKDSVLRTKVGYYDDSWGHFTLTEPEKHWHTMHIMNELQLTENYKYHPFAGEIRPEIQSAMFKTWNPSPKVSEPNRKGKVFEIQNIVECIKQTHVSFIRCSDLYSNIPTQIEKDNAIKMIKMMGYEYFVSAVKLDTDDSQNLTVHVKIRNTGIAPVYYNWDVEFAAYNETKEELILLGTNNWNITNILPNTEDYQQSFTANLPTKENYQILMRFKNPLENKYNFKNVLQLRFANTKQDQHKNGWLTLGITNQ